MTQELARKRNAAFAGRARELAARAPWHGLALAAVLLLSAFLNLFRITAEGYANTYYAAAVKNMLASWQNFFFVSFDAGFVSVDKPPLGLWVQAASAWLFGLHGWALLLPQALAGVLSVALIYHLVQRTFGPVAGLVAALVLALTPIVVVTSRNNTADMLLVLTLLLAAWAFIIAAEKGSLGWLVIGVVVVGLGFNIKMLQAFLVLPAFYLLYLLAAPARFWRRFLHLGVATVVLFATSLSWAVAVDLTSPEDRPFVGSSRGDSVLELAVAYNGVLRVLGLGGPPGGPQPGDGGTDPAAAPQGGPQDTAQGGPPGGGPPGGGPGGVSENGEAGPLRLLNERLAGQAGWLLPLAVAGFAAAGWREGRPRLPLGRRQGALVLWGTWLLTTAAFFSVAGFFHRYYLVMLAPAVAALVGAGVVALWRDYRGSARRGWLLPLALVGTAALHAYVLADYPGWSSVLAPAILGLCLVAAATLVVLRLRPWLKEGVYPALATSVGLLALLVAPAVWAFLPVWEGGVAPLPAAGPEEARSPFAGTAGGPGGGPPGFGPLGSGGPAVDPALVEYLLAEEGDAEYLVTAANALIASPIILETDEPVISLGGFMGFDPVFTSGETAELADEGRVRFFLLLDWERMAAAFTEMSTGTSSDDPSQPSGAQEDPQGGPGGPPPFENESSDWVEENCEEVPRELWQSPDSGGSEGMGGAFKEAQALYDCGGDR